MKIGILTITPNIGFGGNLQAYALKSVLEGMGHHVSIIQYSKSHTTKEKIKFYLKNLYKRIIGRQFTCLTYDKEYEYRRQHLYKFHENDLNFTKKVDNSEQLHKLINESFECVIVGSDQVWRPKYVLGIENYFFKNIDKDILKIAYAVSFGVDIWEFSDSQTKECKTLINEFEYVSVREKSGVELIRKNLKYGGEIHVDLDPTMLANIGIYEKFIKARPHKEKYIFSYVLDKTQDNRSLISLIGQKFSQPILEFNTEAENANAPLKDRVAPPIEDWISGIYYSDFVVTDSFHGCVFAIIFNKPFVVYVNKARGAERFISLLGDYNLLDRVCYESQGIRKLNFNAAIDWNNVNTKIKEKQSEIYKRLGKVL